MTTPSALFSVFNFRRGFCRDCGFGGHVHRGDCETLRRKPDGKEPAKEGEARAESGKPKGADRTAVARSSEG